MRVGQLTELVKTTAGIQFMDRTVMLHIDNAWSQVLIQQFIKAPASIDVYVKPVVLHIERGSRYPFAKLPCPVIALPDSAGWVRRITWIGGDEFDFYPLAPNYLGFMRKLAAGKIIDKICYIVRAGKVELPELPDRIEDVMADIIPTFSSLNEDDEFPMPVGVSENIVGLAVQFITGKTQESK